MALTEGAVALLDRDGLQVSAQAIADDSVTGLMVRCESLSSDVVVYASHAGARRPPHHFADRALRAGVALAAAASNHLLDE
jgi:hypothetical protein